jgi:phosphohistidine phosphatase SixA
MLRRALIIAGAAAPLVGRANASLAGQARQGGVLLIRHASTEPGLGDPPGFRIGQCSTQRNLSEAGRAEARAMGEWFRQHQLQPQAVLSSQWCRCQETARLALGRVQDWPALNSTFAGQGQPDRQLAQMRERLRQLPAGSLEVWVTHQVIMTALAQAYPAMGEGFVVDPQGQLRARGMMVPAS